jgi:hypothetical protein
MSNDFINRRFYDRRRTASGGGGGTEFVEKELILLPTYDTFIYAGDSTFYPGTNERWTGVLPINQSASAGQTLAVGLVNPWLDANDFDPAPPPPGGGQGGGGGTVIVARTPTRTFLQYDLSEITSGSVIMSALLNLTTAGSSYWNAPSQFQSIQRQASEDTTKGIWITYNFDGAIVPEFQGYRAIGWGAGNPSFTWLKFVNGEFPFANGYNPHPGRDHPWCLKAWYKWGARQFYLHMPFGKPHVTASPPPGYENYEHLSYQADQYLCAAEGFFDNGVFYNAPMQHLVISFERIWKTLITGKQHCTDEEWSSLLEWFDPRDPIKVIAYNGAIYGTPDGIISNQFPRWSRLFNENYDAALQRLKNSVQPFINCGMQIGFDALVLMPGPVPGQYISTNVLSKSAQIGWWEFYTWLKQTVGMENIYCEAQQMFQTNILNGETNPNPYLGLNVISSEDWSYFPATTVPYHKMSELGAVNYLRCSYWGSGGPKTFRANPYLSQARYPDLDQYAELSNIRGEEGERRINLLSINTFFGTAFEHIYAARNLKDRYDQEGDLRPENNITKPGYLMSPFCLQEYPLSWGQEYTVKRFIDQFPTLASFKTYLDSYQSPPMAS